MARMRISQAADQGLNSRLSEVAGLLPQLSWGRGREAPDGVWPAASTAVRVNGSRLRHPEYPMAADPPPIVWRVRRREAFIDGFLLSTPHPACGPPPQQSWGRGAQRRQGGRRLAAGTAQLQHPLPRDQRSRTLVGEQLDQHRVRDLAVEDDHALDAALDGVDARLDLRDHAAGDGAVGDQPADVVDLELLDQVLSLSSTPGTSVRNRRRLAPSAPAIAPAKVSALTL